MPIINDPERQMTVDTETGYFVRHTRGYAKGLLEGFRFGQLQADGTERILGGFSAATAVAPRNGTTDPETGKQIVSFYYEIRVVGEPHELPKREIAELAAPILELHMGDYGRYPPPGQAEHIVTINFEAGPYDPFKGEGC